jgi:hypothetical protein
MHFQTGRKPTFSDRCPHEEHSVSEEEYYRAQKIFRAMEKSRLAID